MWCALIKEQGRSSIDRHTSYRALVIGNYVRFEWARKLLGQEGLPLLWALQVALVRADIPVGVVGERTGLWDNNVDILVSVELYCFGLVQPVRVLLRTTCTVEQVDGRAIRVLCLDNSKRDSAAIHSRGGSFQLQYAIIIGVLLVPLLAFNFLGRRQFADLRKLGISSNLCRG